MKKWILNKESRELGATKLVTGHNLDDSAEMVMMNLVKGNPELGLNMGPISKKVSDKKFVPRIRPLFFIHNDEVKKYSQLKGFPVLYEPCPCSVNAFRRDLPLKS